MMASSVCGLVGFAAMEVEFRVEDVGWRVDDVFEAADVGEVPGGWWRRRNFVLEAVVKQDM